MKKVRCAIYTRKSSEEGLEQEFNSLDAQYEACAAYIASQKAEGWVLLPERYDDGGLSGGSMERPGLRRLLADIDRGTVDQILVYKIDRLTRSLADFAKMVERLDAAGTSFVSVTQSFNTATSMGRLTLNMLLSFAQFEREVTAERIRDKIAASKKKGLWMGATVPLGYAADGRSLKIAEPDAEVIRTIYDLYLEHRNTRLVKETVDTLGLKTPVRTLISGRVKGGASFSYGHVHYILTNPVYAGRIRHHAKVYPGQHPPLIDPEVWDSIQDQLRSDAAKGRTFTKRNRKGAKASASPLAGKIFDQTGDRLTPSHSKTANTQSFNTATSMGRLTLNMLLSFAQFEREVTAERIRDKIAASKRKGLWMGGQVPMGYDPEGRTLKINAAEAATIRTLYGLYERLGTIRLVKEEAAQLGLRTRRRETVTGKSSGGGPFDRGHIHQILTNPIYAGRIRHKDKTFVGQHPALIDPVQWDAIQLKMNDGAARARGRKRAGRVSLLCGKLFDETGDRLTPSHTKTSRGTRLRYYISHRLVARSGEANLDGWRLPAGDLEKKTAALVRSKFSAHSFVGQVACNAPADEIRRVKTRLTEICKAGTTETVLILVESVTVMRGEIHIRLDPVVLGQRLEVDPAVLEQRVLSASYPFQLRKRGVETKLILADSPTGIDEPLISNIARAHQWYGQIRSGMTFAGIAAAEATSKRRIQQMIDLAFLAPDIVRAALEGRQPLGFTSDWCLRHTLPSDWDEQRRILATL